MSTRFFTNAGTNTLLAKLEAVFHHNPDIEWFDALVAGQPPSQPLAAFCRAAKEALVASAPAYLRPDAQEQLLATPTSCLAVIEFTVNWEAEKLYGVEGLGPFDEF